MSWYGDKLLMKFPRKLSVRNFLCSPLILCLKKLLNVLPAVKTGFCYQDPALLLLIYRTFSTPQPAKLQAYFLLKFKTFSEILFCLFHLPLWIFLVNSKAFFKILISHIIYYLYSSTLLDSAIIYILRHKIFILFSLR